MPKLPTPPDTVNLRYAQLETLVGNLLEAHRDRKSPLSARFRLFRQRGFPPTATTLSKTRFSYDLEAVLQVTLAFWMMDAFVPQEVVPIVIDDNWDALKSGFRDAFSRIRGETAEGAATDDDRVVVVLSPRNLYYFTLKKDAKPEPAKTVGLEVVTARAARERLFGDGAPTEFAPVVIIDLQRLASWVRDAIMVAGWSGPDAFENFGRG